MLNAQESRSTNYTTEDGLPSSEIYSCHIDKKGYVWFTTDRGIARWNSYEFEVYDRRDGLSSDVNFSFLPINDSCFFTNGLNGKLSFWNGSNFSAYAHNDKLKPLLQESGKWLSLVNGNDSTMILLYGAKTAKASLIQVKIATGEHEELNAHDAVNLNQMTNETRAILGAFEGARTHKDWIMKVGAFSQHHFPFIQDGDFSAFYYEKELLSSHWDSHNRYWIMTRDGAFLYKDGTCSEPIRQILPDVTVTSFVEDSDGGFWITSLDRGVFYFPNLQIKNVKLGDKTEKILKLEQLNNEIYAISEKNKLYKISKEKKELEYPCLQNLWLFKPLENNAVSFGGIIISENNEASGIDAERRNVLHTSGDSSIAFSSLKISSFSTSKPSKYTRLQSSKKRVLDFCETQTNYWFGSTTGFTKIPKNNIGKHVSKFARFPEVDIRVNSIASSENGLWAATMHHGLVRIQDEEPLLYHLPGLDTSNLQCIYAQGDSVLWVGSNLMLQKIVFKNGFDHPEHSQVEAFGIQHGLHSRFINDIEMIGDMIYLATENGLIVFEAKDLKNKSARPSIVIDDIYFSGELHTFSDLDQLSPEDDAFRVFFTGLTSSKPSTNKFYRYQLVNDIVDVPNPANWEFGDTRNFESTNLPADCYTFFVQCQNTDGLWSAPVYFSFTIPSFYWQTLWFKLLALLTFGLLAVVFWKTRAQILEQKISLELRARNAELATLRNQMNPHFIFNSLNSIQNFVFSDQKEKANEYITSFSSMMRTSLNLSRMERVSLQEEIKFIENYLHIEEMRFQEKFSFKVTTDAANASIVFIPPLLVQPLVENAVKHAFKNITTNAEITVHYSLLETENLMRVVIEDNGVGIRLINLKNSKLSDESLGLSIIKDRLKLINERLGVETSELFFDLDRAQGTKAILTIALK